MKLKVSDRLLHWQRARGEIRWSVGLIKYALWGKLPVDGSASPRHFANPHYFHKTLRKDMTWCLSDNIAQMPEVNHLLELSGFHFDLICQIKCNNAVQVGCKATRQALNLMFLTNDQTHNRCRLQRVTWLNRIDVQTRTRRQEEEANWLYTTLSACRGTCLFHTSFRIRTFFSWFLIRLIPGPGSGSGWHR